jgi:hypothetical protein
LVAGNPAEVQNLVSLAAVAMAEGVLKLVFEHLDWWSFD